MLESIKKVILWNFARTTWQYDILCILILVFIFFTPKSWFEGKERSLRPEEISTSHIFIGTDSFSPEKDQSLAEKRLQELTGNSSAKIVGWKKKTDAEGKIIGYEVEIR